MARRNTALQQGKPAGANAGDAPIFKPSRRSRKAQEKLAKKKVNTQP